MCVFGSHKLRLLVSVRAAILYMHVVMNLRVNRGDACHGLRHFGFEARWTPGHRGLDDQAYDKLSLVTFAIIVVAAESPSRSCLACISR